MEFSSGSLASHQDLPENLDHNVIHYNILDNIESKDLFSWRATSKTFQNWSDFFLLKRKNYIPADVSPEEVVGKKNYYLSKMFDHVFNPSNALNIDNNYKIFFLVTPFAEKYYYDLIETLKTYNTALISQIEYGLEKSRFEERLVSHQKSGIFRKLFNVLWRCDAFGEVLTGNLSKNTRSLLRSGANTNDLLNFKIILKIYERDVQKYNTDQDFKILSSLLDLYSVSEKDSIIPLTQTLLYKMSHHYTQDFSVLDLSLMAYHLKNDPLRKIFIELARERTNKLSHRETKVLNKAYLSITNDQLFDEENDMGIEDLNSFREYLNPLDYIFRHFQKKSFEAGLMNLSHSYEQQAIAYRKEAAEKTAKTMKKYYTFKEINKKIQDCICEFNAIMS